MSNNSAVAQINDAVRGETITWGLRRVPTYTGTETVTCALKPTGTRRNVPPEAAPVALMVTATFVPAAGNQPAYWSFDIRPAQSSALAAGAYVADAKVEDLTTGAVDYTPPLVIILAERVTP